MRRRMEVLVPRMVKIVASMRKELSMATMPRMSAPYQRVMMMLEIRPMPVPMTWKDRAQAEPVRISENFSSEMSLWNFRFMIVSTVMSVGRGASWRYVRESLRWCIFFVNFVLQKIAFPLQRF